MTPQYYSLHREEILEKRRLKRISNRAAFSEQDKAKYQAHRQQINERVKAYYWKHRENILRLRKSQYWKDVAETRRKSRIRMKKYRGDPRHKISRKKWRNSQSGRLAARKSILKRKYGITVEQYESMYKAQGGLCAICKRPNDKNGRWGTKEQYLQVDHCHQSKKVRGLLCYFCNVGLGFFEHDIKRLSDAIHYLTVK